MSVGMALLLFSVLVVPAVVRSRARSTLRRTVLADPRLFAALEHERATWIPTASVPAFGPL